MKVFETIISNKVSDFLRKKLAKTTLLDTANQKIFDSCGIKNFFANTKELELLKAVIYSENNLVEEPDRTEYGDFQTNSNLAIQVAEYCSKNLSNPKIVVEPTCGKGNFIVASLRTFKRIEKIFGIEIYKQYVWETKFNIVDFFIDNPSINKPEIEIIHCNVFDFDFKKIAIENSKKETLVIGNPPWVTNSKLSSLESNNLPTKSNFKKHSGFEAITGKGNFDIGEYITLMVFDAFQNQQGNFAFLVKNSVVKNVVFDQRLRGYRISDLRKLTIDSKKEFNVSVEASLFFCKLNENPESTCKEFNFYAPTKLNNIFGWVKDKFVSDVEHYKHSCEIDGTCPFEWRQGIKHDLSALMELERVNGHFVNGLNQEFNLEDDIVYGVLKSSDLKHLVVNNTRKFTIITQKKVGQDTSYIKKEFPKTFNYLNKNKSFFEQRKSSIYNNKPDFSIFGIGDYSFTPYKIAISGLYKNYFFNLVLPQNGKPIMLDDTCYLLGFDKLEFAAYTFILLNSKKTKEFLKSITFSDAKRTFTKDVLMRIDLAKLASNYSESDIQKEIENLISAYSIKIDANSWVDYLKTLQPRQSDLATSRQLTLLEGQAKYKRTKKTA